MEYALKYYLLSLTLILSLSSAMGQVVFTDSVAQKIAEELQYKDQLEELVLAQDSLLLRMEAKIINLEAVKDTQMRILQEKNKQLDALGIINTNQELKINQYYQSIIKLKRKNRFITIGSGVIVGLLIVKSI